MSLWAFVCSVHLCSSVKKNMSFFFCHYVIMSSKPYPVSLCHYVILSKKPHLSPPVPLLFCLQNHPFCYSCPHVTLSSKLPCLPLSSCYSVFKTTLSPFVIMSFCLKKYICLPPSPCYSVFKNYPVWLLILLHISCLRSAFLCCTFASSSGMKTVTGWASDDRWG